MHLPNFTKYQKASSALLFLVFFSFATPAGAENAPMIPPPDQYDLLSDQSSEHPQPVSTTKSEDGKLSIEFTDVSLNEVLKVLSSLSGSNFVTSEDAAKKKISLFLEKVTFEDALEAIVKGNGLIVQKVGESGIFMIRGSTGEDALAPLETRVFKLKYVRAAKVKVLSLSESTSSSSSAGGSSSGSSSGSGVGVGSSSVGTSANVSGGEPGEIKDTIEDLLSPRGKVTVDDRSNSLIVTDSPDRLDQIEKVIAILDHPLDQVLIEAIILETALDFDRFIGTEWGTGTEGTQGTVSGARGVFSIPFVNQIGDLADRGSLLDEDTGLSFGSFDFSQLSATLKALHTDTRTKILAKPKVLVLDNEPAFIKITVNEVIGVNSQVSAGGGTGGNLTTSTAERTETGITLKVTPLINDDNLVTLLLEPRYATADTSTFSSSFRDPRIRASRTTLSVESGKIISISGLFQREDIRTKRKFPILGDIPFFGTFFTKWSTSKLDRELMIFLRPVIVKRENSRIVQPRSIPDDMTTIDEEAAEFWKFWEKPWFKNKYTNKGPSASQEVEEFLNERDKVMDQALTFQNQKNAVKSKQTAAESKGKSKPETKKAEKSKELQKDTFAVNVIEKSNQVEKPKEPVKPTPPAAASLKPAKNEGSPADREVSQNPAASPLRVKPT